jgi:hypothetical protein
MAAVHAQASLLAALLQVASYRYLARYNPGRDIRKPTDRSATIPLSQQQHSNSHTCIPLSSSRHASSSHISNSHVSSPPPPLTL